MGTISRNKYWDELQRLKDEEYMHRNLARIQMRLDIHEQLIKELIKDVEAYIKEHYDGKEEEGLPL